MSPQPSGARAVSRYTAAPLARLVRRALTRDPVDDLTRAATRTWELSPSTRVVVPPAIALEGQLTRVTGWVFGAERDQRASLAGREVVHAPTRAFQLDDAYLLDGTIYAGRESRWLMPKTRALPPIHVESAFDHAAIHESANGIRWFGMWLVDDTPAYALAHAEGTVIAPARALSPHAAAYERWLGIAPERTQAAYVRRLVVFDDVGQNADKRRRFNANRVALRARFSTTPHPGVFVLRGLAGDRRVLQNELELAEHLRVFRGFTVLDPMAVELETLLTACAGARVVAGVEGSALAHALMVMAEDAALLVLEPPDRFCALYKDLTDRDGQRFAYVVGTPSAGSFTVDRTELERTLDLLAG